MHNKANNKANNKHNPNLDPKETKHFGDHSSIWWDELGELKTLHAINPVRLSYVESKVDLKNKLLLDIGCGGGIFTESATKLKAKSYGIDLSDKLIETANLHLLESKLKINYQCISAEDFAKKKC